MPFTERTLTFLMENRLMDSREWFKEHRAEFNEHILDPMSDLLNEIAPAMLEIDPQFMIIPQMGKSISRIWRDTRFLKDKSIFRDNIWFMLLQEKYSGLPSYYFSVSPRGCDWGCGWYQTGNDTVNVIRERILADNPQFTEALEAYNSQNAFTLEGDLYKKTRHPDQPEELRNWLDRKSYSLISRERGTDILFSPDLGAKLIEDFKAIAPVYRFFRDSTVRYEYSRRRN